MMDSACNSSSGDAPLPVNWNESDGLPNNVHPKLFKRADQLFKHVVSQGWQCVRITGSHHIFVRAGRRCLPVAVHGGCMRPDAVRAVLRNMVAPIIADAKADPQARHEDNTAQQSQHEISRRGPVYKEPVLCNAEHPDDVAVARARADEKLAAEIRHLQVLLDKVQIAVADGRYADAVAITDSVVRIRKKKWGFSAVPVASEDAVAAQNVVPPVTDDDREFGDVVTAKHPESEKADDESAEQAPMTRCEMLESFVFFRISALQEQARVLSPVRAPEAGMQRDLFRQAFTEISALTNHQYASGPEAKSALVEMSQKLANFVRETYWQMLFQEMKDGHSCCLLRDEVSQLVEHGGPITEKTRNEVVKSSQVEFHRRLKAATERRQGESHSFLKVRHGEDRRRVLAGQALTDDEGSTEILTLREMESRGHERILATDLMLETCKDDLVMAAEEWNAVRGDMYDRGIADLIRDEMLWLADREQWHSVPQRAERFHQVLHATLTHRGSGCCASDSGGVTLEVMSDIGSDRYVYLKSTPEKAPLEVMETTAANYSKFARFLVEIAAAMATAGSDFNGLGTKSFRAACIMEDKPFLKHCFSATSTDAKSDNVDLHCSKIITAFENHIMHLLPRVLRKEFPGSENGDPGGGIIAGDKCLSADFRYIAAEIVSSVSAVLSFADSSKNKQSLFMRHSMAMRLLFIVHALQDQLDDSVLLDQPVQILSHLQAGTKVLIERTGDAASHALLELLQRLYSSVLLENEAWFDEGNMDPGGVLHSRFVISSYAIVLQLCITVPDFLFSLLVDPEDIARARRVSLKCPVRKNLIEMGRGIPMNDVSQPLLFLAQVIASETKKQKSAASVEIASKSAAKKKKPTLENKIFRAVQSARDAEVWATCDVDSKIRNKNEENSCLSLELKDSPGALDADLKLLLSSYERSVCVAGLLPPNLCRLDTRVDPSSFGPGHVELLLKSLQPPKERLETAAALSRMLLRKDALQNQLNSQVLGIHAGQSSSGSGAASFWNAIRNSQVLTDALNKFEREAVRVGVSEDALQFMREQRVAECIDDKKVLKRGCATAVQMRNQLLRLDVKWTHVDGRG